MVFFIIFYKKCEFNVPKIRLKSEIIYILKIYIFFIFICLLIENYCKMKLRKCLSKKEPSK